MKSIRAKIMWLLFGSVLISSVIIGLLSIFLTSTVIKESSTENMKLLCRNHADKIDISLAKVEDSVDTLAHFIGSELSDIESLSDDSFRVQFSTSVENNALHHIESVDGAVSVYMYYDPSLLGKTDGFFYVKQGSEEVFQRHSLTDIAAIPANRIHQVSWWHTPTTSGSASWVEAYYDENIGCFVTSYIVPVYINDQLIGIIGADISMDYVEDLVKEISVFHSGQAAVLKSDGTVLYHPVFERGELIGEGDPGFEGVIEQLTQENATEELISYKLNKESKKMASCKLRNGMFMICFAPVSEIYHQQNALLLSCAAVTAIVVLLGLLVARIVSKELVRPIENLNAAAKHLTDGEFDYSICSDTQDEIGELTTTFIQTRKVLQHQIRLLDAEAHKDGLTGVGNKSAFADREIEINNEIASGTADFAIAIFDVNKLKVTNDVLGHLAGDRLLLTVANHLSSTFGTKNVYRMGGDEFAVFLPSAFTFENYEIIAKCISGMKDLTVEGYPNCKVSCAYGFIRFDKTTDHKLSDVLYRADREMYKNKALTKKEIAPWPEGTKGLKQLQIDKYCQLLQSLKDSTDDYLFLMNLEAGYIRFFGGSDNQFTIAEGQALSSGISDMLSFVHSNDHNLVKQALSAVLNRETETVNINFRMHNNNNNMRWVNCRGTVINEETGSHFVLIGRLSQNAVQHLYNPVSTLFNKAKLTLDLRQNNIKPFAYLMLLDVDNLSEINLKHGSVYGDNILKLLAKKLEDRFSMWQIFHAEKDRFVVLLETGTNKDAEKVYEQIRSAVAGKCTVSAAVVPNDKSLFISAENIYDYAVQTILNAKRAGKGQLTFFSKQNILEKLTTVELWEELEESAKHGCDGFSLVYQPQIRDEDYTIVSAEALLRFKSKTKGAIYPDQFIPILEQTGLIHDVGLWVLDHALEKCKQWRNTLPEFKVSVNLSPKQLEKKKVAAQIKRLLTKHGLPGEALILEITESTQLDGNEEVYAILAKFRQVGIQIAIDDFGTGYSNLGNLKHIHANILKVDRVFIRDIKENGYNYHLIRNVIEFTRSNDLKVCLEGVETGNELLVLSGLHPDTYQGYLFEKPIPADELESKYLQKDSLEYANRLQKVDQMLKEKRHAPVIKMEMKTILQGINIGLWIIRVNTKSGVGELYTDSKMKELLGVDDSITPKACYDHWQKNIQPEYISAVTAMVEEMKKTDKVIQVEYPWNHPQRGEIVVRCTGRCVEHGNDVVTFEGFHRVISDLGRSF